MTEGLLSVDRSGDARAILHGQPGERWQLGESEAKERAGEIAKRLGHSSSAAASSASATKQARSAGEGEGRVARRGSCSLASKEEWTNYDFLRPRYLETKERLLLKKRVLPYKQVRASATRRPPPRSPPGPCAASRTVCGDACARDGTAAIRHECEWGLGGQERQMSRSKIWWAPRNAR